MPRSRRASWLRHARARCPGGRRWGRYGRLTEERLDKAETFFNSHGAWIITVARFIEVLRQANGIVAGTTGMRWRRFLAFNALGAALWVGTWVSLGYLAGKHIDGIYHDMTRYSYYVLIVAAVVLAAYIARHILRRRRRRTAPAGRQARPARPRARSKTTPVTITEPIGPNGPWFFTSTGPG